MWPVWCLVQLVRAAFGAVEFACCPLHLHSMFGLAAVLMLVLFLCDTISRCSLAFVVCVGLTQTVPIWFVLCLACMRVLSLYSVCVVCIVIICIVLLVVCWCVLLCLGCVFVCLSVW